jgi:Trypsin
VFFRFSLFILLLVSCQPSAPLEISPRDATVGVGEVRSFQATVQGNAVSVRWDSSAGRVNANGEFVAPAQIGVVTLTATSLENPALRDQVNITITPSVSSVSLTPLEPKIVVGERLRFSSQVIGKGNPRQTVRWKASAGTMDGDGWFTAPAQPGSVEITATSLEDERRMARTTVAVQSAIAGLEVTPSQVTLNVNASQRFAARVDGWGVTGVRWETSAGSITSEGVYTAPNIAGVYAVTAISLDDDAKRASAVVTVTNPDSRLEITPRDATLEAVDTLTFQATVTGSSDPRVRWQVSAGNIDENGVFTPPDTDTTVTVTASSVIDPSRTATTTVTITRAAELRGTLFLDLDGNDLRGTSEPPLMGWRVYLDVNGNGSLEANEPSAWTAQGGEYRFGRLPTGTYTLRHETKPGFASSRVAAQGVTVRPQVVGGSAVSSGVHPYMVALLDSRTSDPFTAHYCGGSLIAPRWVLTAAHCVFERGAPLPPSAVQTALGVTKLEAGIARTDVTRIVVHPDYDENTSDFDLALLELSAASNVTPVALLDPRDADLAAAGSSATVLGWGALSSGGSYPRDLQGATVPITTLETCQAAFGALVTPRMICAGLPQGGVDACQGDSGGPLLVVASGGAPLLAGATSWGEGCAEPGKPGVYARVTALISWFETILGFGGGASHAVTLSRGEARTLNLAVRTLR